MTLTEFLLARIAEDEEIARRALTDGHGHQAWAAQDWIELDAEVLAHTERVNPHRVLAECEAKRRIMRRAQAAQDAMADVTDDSAYFIRLSSRDSWRLALSDLASVYADHPDYREEWQP